MTTESRHGETIRKLKSLNRVQSSLFVQRQMGEDNFDGMKRRVAMADNG